MEAPRHFSLLELKPIAPIQGWEDFLRHGREYLKTASMAYVKRQHVFTSEILYNLAAMAIEKFVMAALMRHGAMPDNHTMADLVKAMDENFPGAVTDIQAELLQLDTYQEICDPDGFSITSPGMEKIAAMLEVARKIQFRADIIVANDL